VVAITDNILPHEKRFGDNLVLKGVTVSLDEGSVTALVGPSGGGKTTLCKQLLADTPVSEPVSISATSPEPAAMWICPTCGGPMVLVERLTARQLALRSPPPKIA